jgi:PhoPQ-activated pathogenicity-related protein
VFRALRALHESAAGGDPLPKLEWQYLWAPDGAAQLCVRSVPKARAVRLWTATSADRDFRDDRFSAGADAGGRAAVFPIARPAAGYAAVFAEADYGHLLGAYSLSTNLAVLAAPNERDYGTRPDGIAGVCPP